MSPAHDLTPVYNLTPAYELTSLRDLNLWFLHVAFVQLNFICKVELIEYLSTVLPKAQLFGSAKDL